MAVVAGRVTTLVVAPTKADYLHAIEGAGPSIVPAPADDALAAALRFLDVTAGQFLARDGLTDTPKYHVVAGQEVMRIVIKAVEQKEVSLADLELNDNFCRRQGYD